MDFLADFNPLTQTLIATGFTWLMTALGAAVIYMTANLSKKLLDSMLGFAAGVMIAASFWSLLAPAIEMSEGKAIPVWIPPAAGFLFGALFIRLIDSLLPHLHLGMPLEDAEGIKTSWKRTTLLILAVTLHNIPEGLAVGVAFGAVAAGFPSTTLAGAIALAVGIGIQNFPEGTAVSMPLRREGLSRFKSFWYGQLSGMVEPVAGVCGVVAVISAKSILPYALSFAAGAMIFVVVEELIPESQRGGNTDYATMGAILVFYRVLL
jgi:ZIP family zinc transporter